MTSTSSSGSQLSQVLRQQLQDLRIDPDAVSVANAPARSRVNAWYREHKEVVLTIGIGVVMLVVMSCLFLVISLALMQTPGPGSRTTTPPAETSVSLGDMTVQVTAPAYHPISPRESSLTLHLGLHNTSGVPRELRAGDLLLVDGRGALFPPSWHNADGNSVDGLSDPNHVFMALDPNAEVSMDLQFLVLSTGPFNLRYQRQGQHVDTELPALTLGSDVN